MSIEDKKKVKGALADGNSVLIGSKVVCEELYRAALADGCSSVDEVAGYIRNVLEKNNFGSFEEVNRNNNCYEFKCVIHGLSTLVTIYNMKNSYYKGQNPVTISITVSNDLELSKASTLYPDLVVSLKFERAKVTMWEKAHELIYCHFFLVLPLFSTPFVVLIIFYGSPVDECVIAVSAVLNAVFSCLLNEPPRHLIFPKIISLKRKFLSVAVIAIIQYIFSILSK